MGFVAGLLLGGVIGVLTAPGDGRANRERIRKAAQPSLVRLSSLRVRVSTAVHPDLSPIKQAI